MFPNKTSDSFKKGVIGMKVKMYIKPEQLKRYLQGSVAFASTFRDHDSCFEIEIDPRQIDFSGVHTGLPTNNYFIDPIKD
jgi:hypothetical protein